MRRHRTHEYVASALHPQVQVSITSLKDAPSDSAGRAPFSGTQARSGHFDFAAVSNAARDWFVEHHLRA